MLAGRPGVGPAAVNGKPAKAAGARRGKRTRYDTSSSSDDEEEEESASEDESDEVGQGVSVVSNSLCRSGHESCP